MKISNTASLIALALTPAVLVPAVWATQASAAPGRVTDFRLPPAPTPTATPQVQGPVDVEGVRPSAPRTAPTEAPTTTPAPTAAPTPTPTTAATPSPTSAPATVRQPTPRATRSVAPQTRRQPASQTAGPPAAAVPAPTVSGSTGVSDSSTLFPSDQTPALPTSPAPIEAQAGPSADPLVSAGTTNYTLWLSLIAALVIALGAALVFWPRRQAAAAAAPEIEPPSKWVRQTSDAADLPPLPSEPPSRPEAQPVAPEAVEPPLVAALGAQSNNKSALQIKAQALTLSRSLMNVMLSYRLELMNLNGSPITEVSVKADLITAHGQAPVSEQVADEITLLEESAFVASIDGRETHEVKGSFSLPVNAIRPIAQRNARLYVPLLRLRVDAVDMDPIICTFVVGIKPPERGAKLQPFRLDEMAQTYRNIGLRIID